MKKHKYIITTIVVLVIGAVNLCITPLKHMCQKYTHVDEMFKSMFNLSTLLAMNAENLLINKSCTHCM